MSLRCAAYGGAPKMRAYAGMDLFARGRCAGGVLIRREPRVQLRDYRGAFADRGGYALGGARAHVADCEHAGNRGLERIRRSHCPVMRAPVFGAWEIETRA